MRPSSPHKQSSLRLIRERSDKGSETDVRERGKETEMDAMQIAVPVLGIVAVAAVTFYAVSFAEIREKSFRALDEEDEDDRRGSGSFGYKSPREIRAQRKARKKSSNP